MRASILALASIVLASCTNQVDANISDEITRQFEANAAGLISLAAVGLASWQRVCVLTPYSTNETTEKTLGFEWDSESKTSIGSNDGINVLVFIEAQEVIAYTEHPRHKGDFSELEPKCLEREHSTFRREVTGSGWVYLVPANS
jgi:hypothetical protein